MAPDSTVSRPSGIPAAVFGFAPGARLLPKPEAGQSLRATARQAAKDRTGAWLHEEGKSIKTVQNKLHYAAHGHTAAEVIWERADADRPFMGLTAFPGNLPVLKDVTVAKNYLTAEEIRVLNAIVPGCFDFAEVQAMRHSPMTMKDHIQYLDRILSAGGEKVLHGPGKASHGQAVQKATAEYRRYAARSLSAAEQMHLETIKPVSKAAKKKPDGTQGAGKDQGEAGRRSRIRQGGRFSC